MSEPDYPLRRTPGLEAAANDPNHCPVCGQPPRLYCRCFRGDRRCDNGHDWHACTVHGCTVLGMSDHKRDGCSCRHPGCKPAQGRAA